jgi:hypothetical protein
MRRNAIDCEVLTGTSRNKRILIRLINLSCSGTILPFNFQRIQFPIIPAFAMTINKSQEQHSMEEITKPIISFTSKKNKLFKDAPFNPCSHLKKIKLALYFENLWIKNILRYVFEK